MKFFELNGKLYNSNNVISVEAIEENEIYDTEKYQKPYEEVIISTIKTTIIALITMSNNTTLRIPGKEFEFKAIGRTFGRNERTGNPGVFEMNREITSEMTELSFDEFVNYHLNESKKLAINIIQKGA